MSDTPKFEVIDRRRAKLEAELAEQGASKQTEAPAPAEATPVQEEGKPAPGPRLVLVPDAKQESASEPVAAEETVAEEDPIDPSAPPAPTAEESLQALTAYQAASERLETVIRAQNPTLGELPKVGFDSLVQQLYVSAMIQMGAGGQEGARPRVDIVGAKNTIDLLAVLEEKTRGSLSAHEDRVLRTVLFDVRGAFLELTSMITMQGVPTPPPGVR